MAPDRLRKIHSFTGLVPLALYLGFHAWEHWPVRAGSEPLLARLRDSSWVPAEVVLVLLPLFAHGALGVVLSRQPEPRPVYASPAFRRLQLVTGVISGLFVLWHGGFVWLPALLAPDRASAAFDVMLDQAGTYVGAGLHVFALSAVCIHFGQGLGAAWLRYRPGAPVRLIRILGGALGLILWLVLLEELSVYAGGAPLL